MDFIDAFFKTLGESVDIVLIGCVIIIVEVLKKNFKKVPKKLWLLATILLGGILAWIKTPNVLQDFKGYTDLFFKYAGGAVLLFEIMHDLLPAMRAYLIRKK